MNIDNSDIIIGFSRARSSWKIGSDIIREAEKRDFSHVYVRYKDAVTGLCIVAQASHGYVNEMEYSLFKEHNVIVKEYILRPTDDQYHDILFFIKKNLGKPYSRMQIIIIAIKKLFHAELKISNNDESFICSELGARICQMAGITITGKIDYITPSDLDTLLMKCNTERILGWDW